MADEKQGINFAWPNACVDRNTHNTHTHTGAGPLEYAALTHSYKDISSDEESAPSTPQSFDLEEVQEYELPATPLVSQASRIFLRAHAR